CAFICGYHRESVIPHSITTLTGIITMTIWAESDFPAGQWLKVQDQFERLFIALRAPADMMLVCVDREDFKGQKLIMSLPDEQSLAAFAGFKLISEKSLPNRASLICGISHEFQKRFGFSADFVP